MSAALSLSYLSRPLRAPPPNGGVDDPSDLASSSPTFVGMIAVLVFSFRCIEEFTRFFTILLKPFSPSCSPPYDGCRVPIATALSILASTLATLLLPSVHFFLVRSAFRLRLSSTDQIFFPFVCLFANSVLVFKSSGLHFALIFCAHARFSPVAGPPCQFPTVFSLEKDDVLTPMAVLTLRDGLRRSSHRFLYAAVP